MRQVSGRGMVTALVFACLLASCTAPDSSNGRTEPERSASSAPPSSTEAGLSTLLPMPTTQSVAQLASQLDLAVATLRDRRASEADVRTAGRFQQLAVRTLAAASVELRTEVLARVQPETAQATRGIVRAAARLRMLTDPQTTMPRWRIVAPPPPEELLGYYREAQRRTGVPWTYLAAIHLVETRMGRIRGASTAGALGPMQFIPSTWAVYGAGGDINDPRDAILAAARLLRANGAPGDMTEALWHYNPSDHYVQAVTEYARTMQRSASIYRGYWHWRVLYRHTRGTYVLPVGYPDKRQVLLEESLLVR